jgi:hypothetical protein
MTEEVMAIHSLSISTECEKCKDKVIATVNNLSFNTLPRYHDVSILFYCDKCNNKFERKYKVAVELLRIFDLKELEDLL